MNPANATAMEAEGGGNGEEYEVGKMYEVKLTTGIEFKGIVLAYDSDPHVVIFHILSILLVSLSLCYIVFSFEFYKRERRRKPLNDPLASNKKKRFVDLSGLKKKEAIAIRKIESIGVGVTAEAQKIFDAFSKTHRVKWDNKDIVINEDVRISSPYHSDCVTGGTRAANDQIKKVLKIVREKIQRSSDT
ncbi:Lsm domain protein [Raphanus sativus]|nr:Lsm domain protein [Raphanus sativus]